ncbi:MAG: hypothetical protein Q9217_002900 [Psora testacea]
MADTGGKPKDLETNGTKVQKEEGTEHNGSVQGSTAAASNHSSSSPPSSKRASTAALNSTTKTSATTASPSSTPKPSRDGSPTRQGLKQNLSMGTRSASRSRKNSQELSPIRGPGVPGTSIPTVPSAAAIQRALSAGGNTTPHLPPASQQDASADIPRPQKSNKSATAPSIQSAPRTPRLNSPPPAASSGSSISVVNAVRKTDHPQPIAATPSIVVERPTRNLTCVTDIDVAEEETLPRSGMRTPIRGVSGAGPPLETVQESSLPATPAIGTGRPPQAGKGNGLDRQERIEENPMEEAFCKESRSRAESGNESSGSRSLGPKSGDEGKETRKPATAANSAKPPTIKSKKSYTQLPVKGKVTNEGSIKNMTVETETVSSIPQVAVGGGAGERNVPGRTDTGGSLRLKPSNETIRPKKEKKKVVRKAPSLNAGTDIFEAKVANAVDEADSSDSEETFVYESNPPEPLSARPHRFHSRTPSTASTLSQLDHHGVKGRQDGLHSIVGKKSMKFANNYNSINYADEGDGTVRGPSVSGRGASTPHHHHIGRYGRGGHTSLFDNESPFLNAVRKPPSAISHLNQISPRHNHPKSPHALRVSGNPRKSEEVLSYDLEGEGADDERTPLVGSIRTGRNRRRPLPGSVRHMYAIEDRDHRFCGRVTAFTSLASILALLIAAIVTILVLCAKPLLDVYVKDIRNVLASEQEIMLDLHVHAINPNIIAIQISDLDVNIFAKSRHVGTSSNWRNQHQDPRLPMPPTNPSSLTSKSHSISPLHTPQDLLDQLDGIDEGNDPIPSDPSSDAQTMLLGRILSFDSPLIFDASPFHRHPHSSMGEVRLSKPGNHTEEGGSERWEHVLQHDFELIVRGIIRYNLPISTRMRSAPIGGKVVVHPSEDDPLGNGGNKLK